MNAKDNAHGEGSKNLRLRPNVVEILFLIAFVASIVYTPRILRADGNPWCMLSFWGIGLYALIANRFRVRLLAWIQVLISCLAVVNITRYLLAGELRLRTFIVHLVFYCGCAVYLYMSTAFPKNTLSESSDTPRRVKELERGGE